MIKQWIERRTDHERWGLHVGILLMPIFLSVLRADADLSHTIPDQASLLGWFFIKKLFVWGSFFSLAFLISKVTTRQLFIRRVNFFRTVFYAFCWSLLLRFFLAIVMMILLFVSAHWLKPCQISGYANQYSVHMLKIIFHDRYVQHPIEAMTIMSVISCVFGVNEELWRAGMFAGLSQLYPQIFSGRWGTFGMIVLVGMVFAMAHLYQGAIGIGLTFMIGVGLGAILLYRKSYWEAAITHSLIDVTSFLMIFWIMLPKHAA